MAAVIVDQPSYRLPCITHDVGQRQRENDPVMAKKEQNLAESRGMLSPGCGLVTIGVRVGAGVAASARGATAGCRRENIRRQIYPAAESDSRRRISHTA